MSIIQCSNVCGGFSERAVTCVGSDDTIVEDLFCADLKVSYFTLNELEYGRYCK